jgi:hypothetical protein
MATAFRSRYERGVPSIEISNCTVSALPKAAGGSGSVGGGADGLGGRGGFGFCVIVVYLCQSSEPPQ